jgi:hypothetical protein
VALIEIGPDLGDTRIKISTRCLRSRSGLVNVDLRLAYVAALNASANHAGSQSHSGVLRVTLALWKHSGSI